MDEKEKQKSPTEQAGRLGKVLSVFEQAALYVILPKICLHCSKDLKFKYEKPLCKICEKKLKPIPSLHCKRCGAVLASGGAHCYNCMASKAAKYKCRQIRSALIFTAEIRSIIHEMKYHEKTLLSEYLGNYLISAFKRYSELHNCEYIVPVPLSKEKFKKRGFNQSLLLAREVAKATNLKLIEHALIRVKNTKSQTALTRNERFKNVINAFKVSDNEIVKGKRILLIDDVATTGSTLEGCAVALKKAKAKKVKALTVARE